MKPLKLEFKGLNSFSERATIDFAPLLKSGIFGIFGETGSGKTTILDAINFALYGDIERNPDKIDKINYNCDALEVSFSFDISSGGERRTYLVERTIKRKSGTHSAKLFEYKDGNSVAIADNVKSVNDKITEIIGINKEDFRKCIALPQGEFAQFVNSVPAERIELIERLFNLQKYGKALKAKLALRENEADSKLSLLEGGLSAFEEDTQEALEELETRHKALSDGRDQLDRRAKQAAEDYAAKKALAEQKKLYKAAAEKLAELEGKKPYFDRLIKKLPALSVCETVCASAETLQAVGSKLRTRREDCTRMGESAQKLKANLADIQKKISDGNFESELDNLLSRYNIMNGMMPLCEKFASDDAELKKCRVSYADMRSKLSECSAKCEKLRTSVGEKEKVLSAMPQLDIDDYFKNEFRGGILKDEYAKSLGYIKDLQAEVRTYADDTPLYDYIDRELTRKAKEYRDLILTVKDAKINVNEELANFRKKLEERKSREDEVNGLRTELGKYELQVKNFSERVTELRERGEKLSEEHKLLGTRLKEVFGENTDYKRAVADARAAYNSKQNEKKRLDGELDRVRTAEAENAKNLAAAEAECKALEERLNAAKSEMEARLKDAGMSEVEECRALIGEYGDYKSALENSNRFTAEYASAKSEYARLGSIAGISDISDDAVSAALTLKTESEKELENCLREIAVTADRAKNLKERLNKKSELKKQYETARRERDLIGKLKSLLRDNKFMEYIANEHLVNISRAASKILIELTDGRYYLAYEDNNFCVGDNYNGGSLRKVKTLSGGETFLVSLSLALALSSTICNRSLKSIEFFFLDEGFGTLDGDLIDTVLGALEKLKNENFSIGLISHVEELKHRISSKITVNKATESHGSTISISC